MTDNGVPQARSFLSIQTSHPSEKSAGHSVASLTSPEMTYSLHRLPGWRPRDGTPQRSRILSHLNRTFCSLLVLIASVISLLLSCNSALAVGKKEVLYIDAYHEGLPWSDSILRGIKSGLSTGTVDLRVEHMDTKRIDDKQYLQMLAAIYAHKFKDCRFAAIICSDDAAFQFLLQHHKLLFPKVPIVFCGVNRFEDNMLVGHPELTGVLETADLRTTLEIGLRFHPQTKHVLVINDHSLTGQAHRRAFEQIMPEFATKVTFRFVEDWELAELQDILGKLPPNTIVFQMSLFRDRHGEFISITDGLEVISKSSAAPIYSSWDYLVGHGIVGGMCVSAFRQGQAAIEIALRILRGADPANIPVLKESPNQYMFDHTQLVRFGIDANSLPKGSVVINKPVTWYTVDKRLLWTGSGLVVFLVSSLVVLGIHIRYKQLAEQDLRYEVQERAKAEEKYRGIFENAIEGIFQSTPQGRLVGANPALAHIFGYDSPSQLMEMVTNISTLYVYPERRTEFLRDVRKNKSVSGFEIEFYKRDGSKILATLNARAVLDVNGDLRLIEGMCQDITGRKRAEEALRASEQRYRSIFEDSPVSLLEEDFSQVKEYVDDLRAAGVTDLRGYFRNHPDAVGHCAGLVRVLDVNNATLALLDANAKDELFAAFPRVFSPESLRVFREELIALGEGRQEFLCEAVQITLTGRERLVSLSLNVAPGYEASLGKVLVSLLDITERKRTEELLKRSEQRNALAQRAGNIGSWDWNIQSGRLTWSDNAESMFGFGQGEFAGTYEAFLQCVHPDDKQLVMDAVRDCLKEGMEYAAEHRIVWQTGTVRWMSEKGNVTRDDSGRAVRMVGIVQDITDRKRAEEALRESEEHYKNFFENALAGLFRSRLSDGLFLEINSKAAEQQGLPVEEIVGKVRSSDYYRNPDQRKELISRLLRDGEVHDFEADLTLHDGRDVTFSISVKAYPDKDYMEGAVIDITDRKRAEQALRKSETFLAGVWRTSPVGIAVARDRVFLWANQAWAKMHGYGDPKEIVGLSTSVAYASEAEFERTGKLFYETLRTQTVPETDVHCRRKDGSLFHGHMWLTRVDPENPQEGVIGAIIDVTARKQAEQALRDSEERYRTLFEESTDAILIVHPQGRIIDANPSAGELFGVPRAELFGTDIVQFYADPGERHALSEEVYNKGFVRNVEWKIRRRDGTERTCLMAASAWRDEQGKLLGHLAIAQDITELKRLEGQLRHATKMEAIGRLAGGVAHDFNNLLTVITGYSSMLAMQFPEASPQSEKLLQIRHAADRAASLTRQLLAFSRKQVLEMKVVDLNHVILDVEKMLRRLLGEDIDLVTIPATTHARVKADPDQLSQILMNLAVNARDAMPDGGKLTMEVGNVCLDAAYAETHSEVQPGSYVMLAVSDNGTGMDPETTTRVFEPFFTTKEKGAGTGLGLATVFGIVKQHGGHITVYSEQGQGTTFRVYFPRTEDPADSMRDRSGAGIEAVAGKSILVVEDEQSVRDYACEVLKSLGYVVSTVKDPQEAIDVCENEPGPIHLLLTDVVLPLMDGKSLFERLVRLRPSMKVLYMSGYTCNAIVRHGVLERGVHFLQKPFDEMSLARKISEALSVSESISDRYRSDATDDVNGNEGLNTERRP